MNNEERLSDLLLTWEERFEQGEDLPAADLCWDSPELAPVLAGRIHALKKLVWVKKPSGSTSTVVPLTNNNRLPSTLAGRYRLDERIAEGGSGEVWRAFDLELHRQVAIKLPKRNRFAEDFLEEARKLARLKHASIVAVHDVGRFDGGYFIVSDLIDGTDFGKRLCSTPPSIREAVRIVADTARILHHAHQQGFIHRDIKPPNILVDSQGNVFVTDFGIAVTAEELHQHGVGGSGTLAYMSPEQLHGDSSRIDHRTDIYGLGVVLYQALTGRLPFVDATCESLRAKILCDEPVSPRSINRRVPKELERICLKCLAKSPANRYATAEALACELPRCVNERNTNWVLVGAGLVCCIAVALLGIMSLNNQLTIMQAQVATLEAELATIKADKATLAPHDKGNTQLASDESKSDKGGIRFASGESQGNKMGILTAEVPMDATHIDRVAKKAALFNGKDIEGWEFASLPYEAGGTTKRVGPNEAIQVTDGKLICKEEPKYWLYTREAYGDFVLNLEYRFPYKVKWGTGSAIMLRMTQPGPHHDAHVRVRIGGWATGRIVPPFAVLPQSPVGIEPLPGLAEAERPTGEWNELNVTCVGDAIAVRVNGVQVNHGALKMATEGAIGLAPQGCAVEFRRVALARMK